MGVGCVFVFLDFEVDFGGSGSDFGRGAMIKSKK